MNDKNLELLFTPFGCIDSARVSMNTDLKLNKGFGMVEMAYNSEAQAAIVALNGLEIEGKKISVSKALTNGYQTNLWSSKRKIKD